MKKIFFLDFDGTISLEDTCYLMIEKFCRPGWQELNEQWERGELGTIECARCTFELFDASRDELLQFCRQLPIDPDFPDFVARAEQRGDKIYILSDGYDLNIKTILQQNNLDQIPFYANRLHYSDGKFDITSPYHNYECGQCGTCKKSLLEQLREKEVQIVYVGDGTSDKCAAQFADIVFAKQELLRYCQAKGRQAIGFKSFKDIIQWLEQA